jgi:CRISPR system Cascade subunit CasA
MLSDPIFTIETGNGRLRADFPSCLALLAGGHLGEFQGLSAHQRPAWLLFLYQTATLALLRSGADTLTEDDAGWRSLTAPERWRDYLEALAPATAWQLVNPDPTQPALLQTPQSPGYTLLATTPDELDVLITSKNHDVKMARATSASDCEWLFALVTLQTTQGYSGRGNFGVARMNGGFSSRPLVERLPDRTLPAQFRHGVRSALAARAKALSVRPSLFTEDGIALLWLQKWDSEQALPIIRVDPLVVEICRRVRLVRDAAGQITAIGRASETARLDAPKEAKGNLGDAWTPTKSGDGAALTVGSNGFDYRQISHLLNAADFRLPVAAANTNPWLHLAVLARGQGKTEGYHERWVRLPEGVTEDALGEISERMVQEANGAKQALQRALLNLLQGGPEELKFDDKRTSPWLAEADGGIDNIFFRHLYERAAAPDAVAAHEAWKAALCALVQGLFDRAVAGGISPPGTRRERAHAIAGSVFASMLWRAGLRPSPTIKSEPEEEFHDDFV